MSKKIILITGANGEMGHSLINMLNQQGIHNIVAIDLEPPKFNFKITSFIQGSVLDTALINKINESFFIDSVYHLAAILSTKAEKNPTLANDVNINGTMNILQLCYRQAKERNGIIPFFFPSSIAVYNIGDKREIKIKESDNTNLPITHYGIAKLKCEKTGVDMHKESQDFGIDFRSIRFPGIISGTSMPSGGTSDYAPEMLHYAIRKQTYHCYVNSDRQLPFITMPDAIQAIFNIMNRDKAQLSQNVYNVTSFNPKVEDFYKKLVEFFPQFKLVYKIDKQRQQIVDSWPNDIDDSCARSDWQWNPEHDFDLAYHDYLIPNLQKKYNLPIQ